ncbi:MULTISPECIES: hypothetical protein [unclassified Streptomyces]|uniref:hypothetical protein n=1 Tax=unclassified Streptomyces TaxID=2593676 RepID=UPI002DD7A40A|nr:hypothetical protein [Streptomyces sp. NBC_01750]WSA99619.1 hypothetical protein OIE54_10245 [Streptomyces sp. NBC_01794]WSD35931.1 hypothetical protein OG966_30935 [Streptomyces sp. NBC_01750]
MSSAGAVHRLVIFGDACGSGKLGLEAKKRMRAAMYEAFSEAHASVGIEPGRVHQEDRGDGILAALRPEVPPTLMVGRWIDTLYESLRELNDGSARPLRLRVGMNAGLVLDDGKGLVGRAVDLACRLCDSPTAKQIMNTADKADLLIVVSDWLYVNVVAEGGRYVEPGHYRQAPVRYKETDETAWFHIPRRPEPPLGDRAAEQTGGGPVQGDGPPPPTPDAWTPGDPVPGARPPATGQPGAHQDSASQGNASQGNASRDSTNQYNAHGDMQIFKGNEIHGGFTGINKDRDRSARGEGGDA